MGSGKQLGQLARALEVEILDQAQGAAYGWSTQCGGLWLHLNTHQKAPASGTALKKQEDEVICPRDLSQPLSGNPMLAP